MRIVRGLGNAESFDSAPHGAGRLARQLGGADLLFGLRRSDSGGVQLDVIVIFFLLLLVGAGRDGIAVQQDLVARQIGLQLGDPIGDSGGVGIDTLVVNGTAMFPATAAL